MTKAIPNYTAFTVKANGLADRIIIPVRVCKAFDPTVQPFPNHPYEDVHALWDTGASKSVITRTTASKLALKAVGLADVHHADGTSVMSQKFLFAGIAFSPMKMGLRKLGHCKGN